ncbi:hypothetical protein PENTCL1PPCAC_13659, partial [Pristionchus entomophagus]
IIALLCACAVSCQKTIGVRGQLTCGGKPMPNANITVAAKREYPKHDKVLAGVTSDSQGRFEIRGVSRGIRNLTAVVRVKHSCDFKANLTNLDACERTVTYRVPEEYIAKKTTRVQQWYQLDTPDMLY